ncbi:a2668643-7331-476a-abd0-8b10e6e6311a-CDS [Sclerotinia trifoliorum]|uniref:A2668643-7331-476a-abd0-8b10e6e6311a-CDS n=1 Tax=Sclerotinia trifoliorum TaxID=28548 RepID=A0A8H2W731_9HELO|nr:a2668643-7331-476a-abd0-8b10e6e6311a-CDS [Sclerotinia trifoliorum]
MPWSALPSEIRCMIWEYTFSEPRTFSIATNEMKDPNYKLPVALQVNYESRCHVKRKLPLLFDGTNLVGSENCHFLYFNPGVDTLFLSDSSDFGMFQFLIGPCWNQRWIDSLVRLRFRVRGAPRRVAIEYPEPIKECDIVTSLTICQDLDKIDQLFFFRKLEKLTIDYDRSVIWLGLWTPRGHQTLNQRARMIENSLINHAKIIYGLFQTRINAGFITKIPEILFFPLFSDVQDMVSAGFSTLEFRMPEGFCPSVTMNEYVKDLDCIKAYNDGISVLRRPIW